ncbi:hexose kinase [Nocardia sp.]|uniref:hexose kinase n=1 Tax=Nocardia sp. TaxID=1821 RepID=UPI00261B5B72|nr:hexose kinase [Nocardia sp.]
MTLNPAYDLTYRLDRFEYGAVQRVPVLIQRVGGKGINVSRVLNELGNSSVATGFADDAFAVEAARELLVDFVTALPRVRRTVVLSEADGTTTGLWEPGAEVADPERAMTDLRRRIGELLPAARGVVISGSLPGGLRPDFPAELARLAIAAGIPVICDVDGAALHAAVQVPGVVLMPNTDELLALTGVSPRTSAEVVAVAQPLLEAGVGAIIATRGRAGMVAVTAPGAWSACSPEAVTGNPTGAGDAAAAAVISGLAAGIGWPALLADAVATSAAAVARPVAGEIDHELRDRLIRQVRVKPVGGPTIQEKPCL